ncbi:MAG: hypothetical protein WCX65_05940 [bacterium]
MSDKKDKGERLDKPADQSSEKRDNAKDKTTKSLALAPKVALAYVQHALFFQNEGMSDETFEIIEKGLAVAPDDKILLLMRQDAENRRASGAPRDLRV